jgi:hypothetical protein
METRMPLRATARTALAFGAVAIPLFLTTSNVFALNKQECIQASEKGQQLRDEGKLADARTQFLVCVQEVCPRPVADACREDLAAVEKRLPTVVLSARTASGTDLVDVSVQVDGAPITQKLDGRAVMINPGAHKVRFEANGQVVEEQVVVIEGEKSRAVRVTFPAGPGEQVAPASGTTPAQQGAAQAPAQDTGGGGIHPAVWAFGGLAVVSLGAFAYFGLTGKSDISHLEDTCKPHCKQDDVDAAKTKLLVGDIFLGVAIVSAGAATYFAIAGNKSSTPSVSVGFRPTGVELKGAF